MVSTTCCVEFRGEKPIIKPKGLLRWSRKFAKVFWAEIRTSKKLVSIAFVKNVSKKNVWGLDQYKTSSLLSNMKELRTILMNGQNEQSCIWSLQHQTKSNCIVILLLYVVSFWDLHSLIILGQVFACKDYSVSSLIFYKTLLSNKLSTPTSTI